MTAYAAVGLEPGQQVILIGNQIHPSGDDDPGPTWTVATPIPVGQPVQFGTDDVRPLG